MRGTRSSEGNAQIAFVPHVSTIPGAPPPSSGMAGFFKTLSPERKTGKRSAASFMMQTYYMRQPIYSTERRRGGFVAFGRMFAQLLATGAALALPWRSAAAVVSAAAQFHQEVEPVLKQFCYDCHGDGAKKGKVAFDELTSDDTLLKHDLWIEVLKNLRAGLMPPEKKARPSEEERLRVEQWIKSRVFGINPKNPDPGRTTARRLNRVEYRNTVRDLLGIDYNTQAEFPPDDTGYGFDNIGDVLTVSPMLLEKYLDAAKQVVADSAPLVARVMQEKTISGTRFTGLGANGGGGRRGGNPAQASIRTLSFYKPAAVSNSFTVDVAGSYTLALNLAVKGSFEFDPGKCRVVIALDGKELMNQEFGWYNDKKFPREFPEKFEPGPHQITLTLEPLVQPQQPKAASDVAGPAGETRKTAPDGTRPPAGFRRQPTTLDFRIESVVVRGPMEENLWVKPRNYDKFFTRNEPPKSPSERRKYAREVLTAFAAKAFRRPVDSKTADLLVELAEGVYNQPGKTFEAGIAHALVGVLASPRFTFRIEENLKGSPAAPWGLVDEYTLASRLSYFLWSSMPDQELFNLAAKGELRQNLPAQVKRMLADSRSEALAQNFTGQWLQARDVGALSIDARAVFAREAAPSSAKKDNPAPPGLTSAVTNAASDPADRIGLQSAAARTNYSAMPASHIPATTVAAAGTNSNLLRRLNGGNVNRRGAPPRVTLDDNLRRSMRSETEMYFSNILHEDRSVMEFIESDYTFLNSKLAQVYGLTNLDVSDGELVKVTLPPGSPRGGVLTEGTVLTVTSNPDRTSPVKRGLFILSNILGAPVPPPPPNIPALEIAEKDFKGRQPTLREALQVHRENALCASCHSRMDPIGLGMENFNALGVWREKERGQTIETAGKLITGESFNSVQELKHILATKHKTDFYRCLTEKLLTYALGRGTEYYDTETVDQIVQRLDRENGRFGALLMGVIESAPFQKQRSRANTAFTENRELSGPGQTTQMAKNKAAP
jgi:hypothetical protein